MSETDISRKLHEYIRELESAINDLPCGPEVLSDRGRELYEWYNYGED